MKSMDHISYPERQHTAALRKRKPKRQGSRAQVGKKLPHQYPKMRMPICNMTYQSAVRPFRQGRYGEEMTYSPKMK